jgi:hypothetical protein
VPAGGGRQVDQPVERHRHLLVARADAAPAGTGVPSGITSRSVAALARTTGKRTTGPLR